MKDNVYEAIMTLVVYGGYDILNVVLPDGTKIYYFVYRWQEAYFNTAQSIEYHTVEGIDITEFITKNAETCRNYLEFIKRFDTYIEASSVIRCEFSKNVLFYKWSLPKSVRK